MKNRLIDIHKCSPLVTKVMEQMGKIKDLSYTNALLQWDQEIFMPSGGANARAEQIATIDTLQHQILTSSDSEKLYNKIKSNQVDLEQYENNLLNLFVKEFERANKIPEDFIKELSKCKTLALESWRKAREFSNFALFQEDLQKLIDLKIQEAGFIGNNENPYNVMLDEYEEGANAKDLSSVFSSLRDETIKILDKIKNSKTEFRNDLFDRRFSKISQLKMSKYVTKKLNYNFYNGRLDISTHPFTTSFSKYDVRITTRINKHNPFSSLLSTIHEAGHGLYEQGMDDSISRTFAEDGASYGIHESQSLFWENIVSRSLDFWQFLTPKFNEIYSLEDSGYTAEDYFKLQNQVQAGFIRTESDELTYNMHIIIRFEIENALINKKLKVADIPEKWNQLMQKYLGITPDKDSDGCLQDIHWSFGGFGYFPTYTLGKLYSSTIAKKIRQDIPSFNKDIASGNFLEIRKYLEEKIHRYGKLYTPSELMKMSFDAELNSTDFINYIDEKMQRVYGY